MALTAKLPTKPGRYADRDGLYLLVKPTGARSWLLRVQFEGRRRDIGLGSVRVDALGAEPIDVPILQRAELTLADAREKAGILRRAAKAGRDPVAERDRERRAPLTFREAAREAHGALSGGWATKTADAFLSSLERHAYPAVGDIHVADLDADDLARLLRPIWDAKPAIAAKVRTRVCTVLDYAKAMRWRLADAPRASLRTLLHTQAAGGQMAAMPYSDVPGFVADLRAAVPSTGRLALLFLIFTAARSGEVRKARWKQFDLKAGLWNRPADLMKGKKGKRKPHTVTLNAAALAILNELAPTARADALVFGNTRGNALSDMTLSKIMRDAGLAFVPHGFRSSFRDWAAELMPTIPDPVAEAALAHAVPEKVVAAYKRTTFLEMRRKLLDAWGAYLTRKSNVVRLVAANG